MDSVESCVCSAFPQGGLTLPTETERIHLADPLSFIPIRLSAPWVEFMFLSDSNKTESSLNFTLQEEYMCALCNRFHTYKSVEYTLLHTYLPSVPEGRVGLFPGAG